MTTKDLDLRFRYRAGSPVVASEECRLAEEERGIVLEVLSRHFERLEPGAFAFDWFDPDTLSPLQRFQRDRGGEKDPQRMARDLALAFSTPERPLVDLSEQEKRQILIRETVEFLIREIRSMNRAGVRTRLGATDPERPALIDHLLGLNLNHPTSAFDGMAEAGESIRKRMREDLGREPSHEEWHGQMYQVFVLGRSLPLRTQSLPASGPIAPEGIKPKSAWVPSPKEKAVLQVLRAIPAGEAMTGPQIIDALGRLDPPVDLDSSVLTRHIIPSLKTHASVDNQPGRGYFIARA